MGLERWHHRVLTRPSKEKPQSHSKLESINTSRFKPLNDIMKSDVLKNAIRRILAEARVCCKLLLSSYSFYIPPCPALNQLPTLVYMIRESNEYDCPKTQKTSRRENVWQIQ